MNTNLDKLSAATLRRAADLYDKIEAMQSELEQILSGKKKPGRKAGVAGVTPPVEKPAATTKKKKAKRNMSAEGRAAISAAAKKRWADKRKADKAAAKAAN